MTTIDTRRPPLFLLPVVLLVVLFGVAVLLAQVAPGRVTSGVYQAIVWEGPDQAVIPSESLACERAGDTATCTTPVGRDQLTIDVGYTGAPLEASACAARHGDRTVSCRTQMGYDGHASHTVWIHGLGLSGAQLAELREAVPWWRGRALGTVALAFVGTLAAAAGVVTFLLRRRARPASPDRRLLLATGTGAMGLGLFVATVPVFGLAVDDAVIVMSPFALLAAAALAVWQWQLSGAARRGRVVPAVVAVTSYAGVAMLVFLLQSGFVD